jgi:hypothetical protein
MLTRNAERSARNWPAVRLALALSALMAAVAIASQELPGRDFSGQFGQGRRRAPREMANLEPGQVQYDGHFTFARLRFQVGDSGGGFGEGMFRRRRGGSEPPWSHDYPRAERNFMKIIKEISTIDPYMGPEGGTIVDIGGAELFKFPVAYMAEAGFWTQTDQEAANLRGYLEKGCFIIFDDFFGGDWVNFEEQMARVLPGARLVELDLANPIFHSFFEIESLDFVQAYERDVPASFYGVFEDNDPKKRLLIIANYNNDIGEYWEFSDTGWTPIDLSNEAYKFGVNYVVYGMTH